MKKLKYQFNCALQNIQNSQTVAATTHEQKQSYMRSKLFMISNKSKGTTFPIRTDAWSETPQFAYEDG